MRPPPTLGGGSPDQPIRGAVSCMQLNFRRIETTWVLCQQELLNQNLTPDVILIQDPPSSALGDEMCSKGTAWSVPLGREQSWGKRHWQSETQSDFGNSDLLGHGWCLWSLRLPMGL